MSPLEEAEWVIDMKTALINSIVIPFDEYERANVKKMPDGDDDKEDPAIFGSPLQKLRMRGLSRSCTFDPADGRQVIRRPKQTKQGPAVELSVAADSGETSTHHAVRTTELISEKDLYDGAEPRERPCMPRGVSKLDAFPKKIHLRAQQKRKTVVHQRRRVIVETRGIAEVLWLFVDVLTHQIVMGGFQGLPHLSSEEEEDEEQMGDPPKQYRVLSRGFVEAKLVAVRKAKPTDNSILATDETPTSHAHMMSLLQTKGFAWRRFEEPSLSQAPPSSEGISAEQLLTIRPDGVAPAFLRVSRSMALNPSPYFDLARNPAAPTHVVRLVLVALVRLTSLRSSALRVPPVASTMSTFLGRLRLTHI